jgi:methionyl-tRNA formyltransferase
LPKYRGSAPINWAVINGESITGVTTFQLQQEIDTGNILMQDSFPIGPNDTAGEVHDKMKEIGARLLVQTIKGIAESTITEQPQLLSTEGETVPLAPKLFTETCRIDFQQKADQVHNLIRGLSPFPGAFTEWEGKKVKIFRTERITLPAHELKSPGSYSTDQKTYLWFYCGTDAVSVLELQLEGKKRMKIDEFLRGYRFNG